MNFFSYLTWHFGEAPRRILSITANYLVFCEHFFSINILLRTLFAPWKRQTFQSGPGFSLGKYFETVVSNLVSRILGAIVRSIVIVLGILAQFMVLVIGVVCLFVFVCLPFVTLPIYYQIASQSEQIKLRKKILTQFYPQTLPNLSNSEIKNLAKTTPGKFLFSRLSISREDLDSLDLGEIAKKYNLGRDDFYEVIRWFNHAKDEAEEYAAFWELFNLLRIRPLGRDWVYGYTINLDKYTTNLVDQGYALPHLVGRREEIDRIQRILAQSGKNNVILAGDPGSGRHAIVLAFALDIFEGKVMDFLKNKRVLELNLNLLISEAKEPTQIKGIVNLLLNEAISAGNIILVLDNFEKFTGSGQNSVDLTDVFTDAFSRSEIQAIAITNREAYHKTIVPNSALVKIFEVIEIDEISTTDTLRVLEHLTGHLETKHQVFIPYLSLKETLKRTQTITNLPYPEKAIEVLRETALLTSLKKQKVVSVEFIDQVISQKTKIPQGALAISEKDKLQNLETLLHEQVIDQELAILKIAQSLRRARLEIAVKGKPIGSFLFLGPTGVGKTETAKTLARVYFGSEKQMIRLDMSQFSQSDTINNLLGNPENDEPGILVKQIRDNPFTVLLLDEIEKAGQEVLNLFLTILDEGYINDNFGRRISFENTIIIGTSNAGSEFIRQRLNENPTADLTKDLSEHVLKEKIFSPEFINRFDAVVVYKPLSEEHLKQIAILMLNKLNLRLKAKNIQISINDELVEKIAKEGYDPQFGARPMQRVIQEKVEDYIAQKLLNGEIKEGETVEINI